MRTGSILVWCCCIALACALPGRADDDTPSPTDAPDLSPGSEVPDAFLNKPKPSAASIAAEKAARAEVEANADWMVKGYEQALKDRAAEDGQSGDSSSAAMDDKSSDGSQDAANADAAAMKNSTDPSGEKEKSASASSGSNSPSPVPPRTNDPLAPLITPMSTASNLDLQHFDLGPSPTTSIFSSSSNSTAPAPVVDSEDMDVPGMTAVDRNPQAKDERDLNLDLLPGEDPAQAAQDHALDLQLPSASVTDQLQKQDSAVLVAPGYKKAVPVAQPLVPAPSDTSEMVPDPMPSRVRIADPYDILQ
jgi:hypothetical protein